MRAPERLDVLVVGAGLSGVAAAHYLRTRCPWATFAIVEARGAIGGTWDLFRYPGVRSDSDMYTLGYSFRPWRGERAIAGGDEIRRYIEEVAAAEGITERIRFRHRVVRAEWSSADDTWRVTVERTDTGETSEIECGFLFCCTGYYRYDRGHLPEFPGTERFAGRIVHPQAWPEDLDCAGARVVVIGSGATAITLVPALARSAAHVTMLQRTPTYVISLPDRSPLARLVRAALPGTMGAATLRWANAVAAQGFYRLSRRHPALVRRLLIAGMRRQLPAGFDVDRHFTPPYDPWDQRLCVAPDGDLFRAIRSGKASVVTDTIDTFVAEGIRLASGEVLAADVVVTATGLELLFCGGIELRVDGEPIEPADRMVYRGAMLEGVPNLAVAIGYTNASWTLRCELTCRYVCRLLDHMRATGVRRATPRPASVEPSSEPLLGLNSGYVKRAVHLFPKQGSRPPWRLSQSFLDDWRSLHRTPVDDGHIVFGAGPVAEPSPVAEVAPVAGR